MDVDVHNSFMSRGMDRKLVQGFHVGRGRSSLASNLETILYSAREDLLFYKKVSCQDCSITDFFF